MDMAFVILRSFLSRLPITDKAPISREALNELIEMHMVVFMMSLKRFFRDGEKKEEASEYYKRHIRMLHYGICAYRSDSREEEQR